MRFSRLESLDAKCRARSAATFAEEAGPYASTSLSCRVQLAGLLAAERCRRSSSLGRKLCGGCTVWTCPVEAT